MSSADSSQNTTTCRDEFGSSSRNGSSPPAAASRPFAAFTARTIAPSPPPSHLSSPPSIGPGRESSSPLRISTDVASPIAVFSNRVGSESFSTNLSSSPPRGLEDKASFTNLRPVSRTPSVKAAIANYSSSFGSASVTIPSPVITALGDMTPLPSPLLSGDSPGPWKRLTMGSTPPPQRRESRKGRREPPGPINTAFDTAKGDSRASSTTRRKQYGSLEEDGRAQGRTSSRERLPSPRKQTDHSRNRSVSEYTPDAPSQKRNVVVSGSHIDNQDAQMRREMNFAESRGITPTVLQPPTPPPSESSKDSTDGRRSKDVEGEWFEALGRLDHKFRRWRSVGFLGQGTFSRVMLASSQIPPAEHSHEQPVEATSPFVVDKSKRKKLVAIKICEHGPRGGASEERIEMSLKRELEIMQDIHHPSLVNLKAWSIEPTRAILVLSFCPGGDLFEIATANRELLTPAILRRIFAELVGAVKYLHAKKIVHRDIKLENVLVNLTPSELADAAVDWKTYPTSLITLADLGLARRIADDEKLETRCGSDDYAAPEVIMGQPYDGRATDAWSLGVLLYALLESRLPFDPHPGMTDAHRMRSRTSHRIARVEWRWVEFAGDDGDHEANEAKFRARDLLGAMEITEGLLKRARSRWSLDRVAAQPWVRDAIQVEGGVQFRDEDEGEEV